MNASLIIRFTGRRDDADYPVKEGPVAPSVATSSGYSQSKWVIERLLQIAEGETPLKSVTIRLGQVAGSTTGAWNRDEWFPALVASSKLLGCLPNLEQVSKDL